MPAGGIVIPFFSSNPAYPLSRTHSEQMTTMVDLTGRFPATVKRTTPSDRHREPLGRLHVDTGPDGGAWSGLLHRAGLPIEALMRRMPDLAPLGEHVSERASAEGSRPSRSIPSRGRALSSFTPTPLEEMGRAGARSGPEGRGCKLNPGTANNSANGRMP